MTNKRLLTSIFTLFAVTTLTACGDSDEAAPHDVAAQANTAVIGPAGGTLTGPDGVQVEVPPGALDEPTTIGIARSSAGAPASLPEDITPAGSIYEFTPHDVIFKTPVTIRMPVPANAVVAEALMASPGGDWQVQQATVNGHVAEWQRNSFSWGFYGGWCTPTNRAPYSDSNPDPYQCWSGPYGGTDASATPAVAITRTGWPSTVGGSAGSWTVNQASTVHLTTKYAATPDCENARLKLIRMNPALPLNAPARVQTLFDQPVTITPTPIPGLGGGTYFRAIGSTTIDLPFSHLDNGTAAFGYSFSCNRPYRSARSGGDWSTFVVSIPVPTITYTIGGTVTGLTGSGLVLQNNGGDNLAVATDGTFTFATAVAANAPYNASVQAQPAGQICSVQNGSGTAQANIANVAVSCVARGTSSWQGAGLLETLDVGDVDFDSDVAFDANGNAVAVWSQITSVGARFNIWARHYTPGSGWGVTTQITTNGPFDYLTPQVAFDANGDAIVVFAGSQRDGAVIAAARYTAANSSWGVPVQLTTDAINPKIVVDASGNAMVVWQSWNGGSHDIGARRYVANTGIWEPAQLIESDMAPAGVPQIAIDASGNAAVVWSQSSAQLDIWANHYAAGIGWGTATLIEAGIGDAENPHIAFGAAGNAMAVWEQHDGTATSIFSNHYSAGSWGQPVLVESSTHVAHQSSVAMNANGNAIVTWREVDASGHIAVWARRYVAGVGEATTRIDDISNYTSGGITRIAMDVNGNAVAVWAQSASIWANRYLVGTGWSGATLIDSSPTGGPSSNPQIAIDSNGNALAVWPRRGVSVVDMWGSFFR